MGSYVNVSAGESVTQLGKSLCLVHQYSKRLGGDKTGRGWTAVAGRGSPPRERGRGSGGGTSASQPAGDSPEPD